jgi:hypothetical protein
VLVVYSSYVLSLLISQFNYLGCSIRVSCQISKDVEFNLAKFLQLIGTKERIIFKKVKTEIILKIYNTLVLPTFLCVRKLDSYSLTKDEELKRQK